MNLLVLLRSEEQKIGLLPLQLFEGGPYIAVRELQLLLELDYFQVELVVFRDDPLVFLAEGFLLYRSRDGLGLYNEKKQTYILGFRANLIFELIIP